VSIVFEVENNEKLFLIKESGLPFSKFTSEMYGSEVLFRFLVVIAAKKQKLFVRAFSGILMLSFPFLNDKR
jgi:hypothetical protein